MEVNFSKICRICLKEGDNYKSIFFSDEFPKGQVALSTKIMACSSIQVAAGDGLPELICLDCLTQVDIAYEFREKCLSSDATLRKYISFVKPYLSYTDISNRIVKVEESDGVKIEIEENLDIKQNIISSYSIPEISSPSKDNTNNSLQEIKVPAPVQRKKNREKVEEAKLKRQRGGKKVQEEEGGSDCDKKKKSKEEKDVTCPICKKTFAYLCILKDHMVQHTGAKPYLCSVCGKSFGHTASLTNHMKTHYSDKPHKCDRCELSFHRRAHLVLHMRTHTGEKPFVCEVCGRDFAQSSYLKEHMRVHSGEKPFVCDICGHGFARKSCLVMHRRIHTGELPYACPECGRAFSQRSQRKRHVKRNHKGSTCLRATGELILKDLDHKNKTLKQEEMIADNSLNENSLNESSLNLPQENGLLQRENSMTLPEYQPPPPPTDPTSSMVIYQQENLSSIYSATVMPLPLIQIQGTLLQ